MTGGRARSGKVGEGRKGGSGSMCGPSEDLGDCGRWSLKESTLGWGKDCNLFLCI